ncbi:MAG TPA: hypothetical protein VND68_04400 [Chloroflexia bacterium]|jgi:hypothetical protein|nr:hypothetical protein [Chloroflexia bacterium]
MAEASEEYFPHDRLAEDYDPATANDFTYEDAVLDTRVRAFMREEYGRMEPPRGMFQRLVWLLNAEQTQSRGQKQSATGWARLFVGAYRAFSGQTLSRLLPSGIAVAILVVAGLGSTAPELLRNSPFAVGAQSTPMAGQAIGTSYESAPNGGELSPVPPILPGMDVTGGEEIWNFERERFTVNVPPESRQDKDTDPIKHNRPRLDPF